jgi:hypothetical protein
MNKFRPYKEFTAQGINVATLMSLYQGLDDKSSRPDLLTPIVVFLAFSIESYVNSLGAQHLGIWDELERLPWKKKISILYKVNNQIPDWGSEPLQFASEVFKIRDKLAHGKPEVVYGPTAISEQEAMTTLRDPTKFIPSWYKDINKSWVLESKTKFESLMLHLGGLFGSHEWDHKALAYTGIEEIES